MYGTCMVARYHSTACYGAFTHTSMGGREVQNQNLQKCMKVVRERLAEVGGCRPSLPAFLVPLSAPARGCQASHASVCNLQSKCAIQPASHARAGWLADRMHSSSQPAARAHALCMQSLDALRSDHALYACRTSGVPDHWSLCMRYGP